MSIFDEKMKEFNLDCDYLKKELENKNDVSESDSEKSGIYAIYITNYINDYEGRNRLIFPIYIGQSKNILYRKNQHLKEIKNILNLTNKEFNERLKKHREKTYLYFKIRKCLEECNLNIDNIKFKVLEYCESKKEILDKIEQDYIEKYCGIKYGFNQFETVHYIPQFKYEDKYFYEFLNSTKKDFEDCLNRKYFWGFRDFNVRTLCYNVIYNMNKMTKHSTEDKNLIKLNSQVVELIEKMIEYYGDDYVYCDLEFIDYILKI